MKTLDRFSNSWEIELLESYAGDLAHFFKFNGLIAHCIVPKENDDTAFQLELMTVTDDTEVIFYLQPIDEEEDTKSEYVTILKVPVADPEGHEKMKKSIKMIFEAMGIERRLSLEEPKTI
jgi:hypothetical protein